MKGLFLISVLFFISFCSHASSVIIQSTTSTRDSGLYDYLLPHYPDFNKINIKVIAVGTGQAIMNAKNCDGNILIVHDKEREIKFLADGYGTDRHNLMYNDFIIIGPSTDEANIASSKSVQEAFFRIYKKKYMFISRADSSGTHSSEISIWNQLKLDPSTYSGKWYMESGQGMGPSLNIAISLDAYILSDRSTWLRFKNKQMHKIVYENSSELRNDYGMILVNHEKCKNLDYESSLKLYNWLASEEAAVIIRSYKVSNSHLFYID
jgi:tungstate transport system substrate-binding protein